MPQQKNTPWRWVAGILAICYIVWMWVKKDVLSIYASLPAEQALPLLITSVAVSILKVAALAGLILLGKWLLGRLKR